jgi:hypothetical protein
MIGTRCSHPVMRRRPGRANGPRTVLLAKALVALLTLIIGALPARLAAEARDAADPPDLILRIDIDPATGAVAGSALLRAPVGDVTLPDAPWLSIDALELAGAGSVTPARPGVIPEAQHRNRDLSLTVSGRLPAPEPQMSAAVATPEATHLVGPVWFPADAAGVRDIEARVRVPSGQRVAATGSLLTETETDTGTGTEARFAFQGFAEDFGLFVGRYSVTEELRDGLRLRTYFETDDPALSQRYLDAVARYIARYEATVGDYPHDGFSVVSTPMPVGLGFAGLTYVSRDILGHPYMTGRSLAHEVLHSWWGNAVGIDFATGNWAEGLTTFQADYALAEDEGPKAARTMRIGWIRDLARLDDADAQPLTAFRSSALSHDQSEGYGKAAFVFHMLRDELGPETFADGIRRFYAENRHRIAGWRDLQASFEAASGRALGWFFEQWTDRAGLPDVTLALEGAAATEDGFEIALALRQTAPHYRLRMPVVVETAAGPVRHVVRIDGPRTRATLHLDARPISVALDPGFDIARRPRAGEPAPILQDAREAGAFVSLWASGGAAPETEVAEALAPLTGGVGIVWQDEIDATPGRAVLIAGHPDDVLASRPGHLGALPATLGAGATQLWVERDGAGRLWLFLAFEDAAELSADLRNAVFFAGQSHLTAEDGRVTGMGTWPDAPRNAIAIGLAAQDVARP